MDQFVESSDSLKSKGLAVAFSQCWVAVPDRFPRSVLKPGSRPRHLYAGRRWSSNRFSLKLIRGQKRAPLFDDICLTFDTSTVVRGYSFPSTIPTPILCRAFSLTLNTLALYQSTLRCFEACSEGPPLIFRAAWLHLTLAASAYLRCTLFPVYLQIVKQSGR